MARLSDKAAGLLRLLAKPGHFIRREDNHLFDVIDDDGFSVRRAHNLTVKTLRDKGYVEATKKNDAGHPMIIEITEDGKSLAEFIEEGESEETRH